MTIEDIKEENLHGGLPERTPLNDYLASLNECISSSHQDITINLEALIASPDHFLNFQNVNNVSVDENYHEQLNEILQRKDDSRFIITLNNFIVEEPINVQLNYGKVLLFFRNTTFKEPVEIINFRQTTKLFFESCTFNDNVSIKGVDNCAINETIICNSIFNNEFHFTDLVVTDRTFFSDCHFHNVASFRNTAYRDNLHFNRSTFHFDFDFSSDRHNERNYVIGEAWFSDTKFLGIQKKPKFYNRVFESTTSFLRSQFEQPPDFNQSILHHSTDFSEVKFPTSDSDYSTYYAILKRAMEDARNHKQEGKFHALEHKCLRKTKYSLLDWFNPRKWSQWLISWSYFLSSNYGQNVFLPLLWLIFTNVCFGILYFFIFCEAGYRNYPLFKFTFLTTLEHITKGYSKLPSEVMGKLGTIAQTVEILFPIASIFQSILSAIFLSLLLLAIRRRFKLRG